MEFLLLFYYLCICQKKKKINGKSNTAEPPDGYSSQGFACVPEGVLMSMGVCALASHSHSDTYAL